MEVEVPHPLVHQRDLSPVLPKKLHGAFLRIFCNYALLVLLAFLCGKGYAAASFVMSFALGLVVVMATSLRASSLVAHALAFIFCLLQVVILFWGADYPPLWLEAISLFTVGVPIVILVVSARSALIAMGPRQHALKRLHLAEYALPLSLLLVVICLLLCLYVLPLKVEGLSRGVHMANVIGASPYLFICGLAALLALFNFCSTWRSQPVDLSAWQDSPQQAEAEKPWLLRALLLCVFCFAASIGLTNGLRYMGVEPCYINSLGPIILITVGLGLPLLCLKATRQAVLDIASNPKALLSLIWQVLSYVCLIIASLFAVRSLPTRCWIVIEARTQLLLYLALAWLVGKIVGSILLHRQLKKTLFAVSFSGVVLALQSCAYYKSIVGKNYDADTFEMNASIWLLLAAWVCHFAAESSIVACGAQGLKSRSLACYAAISLVIIFLIFLTVAY